MSNYLTNEEIKQVGFKTYGINLFISKDARFYNPSKIILGNNIRIDDFCLISAGKDNDITIDDYVHIAANCLIYGAGELHIKSFTAISSGCKIYTLTDDFTGDFYPTLPMLSNDTKNILYKKTIIDKYVIIGTNSVVLPGCNINEGVAIGACSLVNKVCKEWSIYIGSPIRFLKNRSKQLLDIKIKK
jgi:galactoside O-acetyltransferase